MNENILNEAVIRKDLNKCLNENERPDVTKNRIFAGFFDKKVPKERTFADWFGEDLTGQTYDGDINCSWRQLTSLKGAPKIVNGNFNCSHNILVSLKDAPKIVNGDFDCCSNKLTSLEGAPEKVGGDFMCHTPQNTKYITNGSIESLKGAPKEVGGDFDCSGNKIDSLEGVPEKIGGGFNCYANYLTSLEGVPEKINGNFNCGYNKLTSLQGAPKEVGGNFYCNNNQLTSLEGVPKEIGGDFDCSYNQLTSLEGIGTIKGLIKCDSNNRSRKTLMLGISSENLENIHSKEIHNGASKISAIIKTMKNKNVTRNEIEKIMAEIINNQFGENIN